MNKFKVGDKVVRTSDPYCVLSVGTKAIVTGVKDRGELRLLGSKNCWDQERFKLEEAETAERPHKDVIIAWANGVDIQFRTDSCEKWGDINNPCFHKNYQYRVKPVDSEKEKQIASLKKAIDEIHKKIEELIYETPSK